MTGKKTKESDIGSEAIASSQDEPLPGHAVSIRNIRKADPRRPMVNKITLEAGVELRAGEVCDCAHDMALELVARGWVEIL